MRRRRKKPGSRGLYNKRLTPDEQVVQREAAFAAIRRLYCETLPLWRVCARGSCRRHRRCHGEAHACLTRGWPMMTTEMQEQASRAIVAGGPNRRAPATQTEWQLRRFPASNFVH
jgi:hypothetical protein